MSQDVCLDKNVSCQDESELVPEKDCDKQIPNMLGSDKESKVDAESTDETVNIKIVYNKQKYDISFPLNKTVAHLKSHIQDVTGVPDTMQKIMYRGRMKDDLTLKEQQIIDGAKIMVIGSTVTDVLSVSAPKIKDTKENTKGANSLSSKEPLSKQKPHKTILEKHGKPEDAIVGIHNHKESLPLTPLSGMYNKVGGKVRLTFKLETDQLWLGTKERTEKLPMTSIKDVKSEPLADNEEYHMMGLQLGPTEASRYWIYWVPAQYVDAIKDAILGTWQPFPS